MTADLWSSNTPDRFWLCQPPAASTEWQAAIRKAASVLELPAQPGDKQTLEAQVLGEGQFGPDHWCLSPAKRFYYTLKPVLPRALTCFLRRVLQCALQRNFQLVWPIEDRYARFQWEVMRQMLKTTVRPTLPFRHFWPEGYRFAFVLTHDVETAKGLAHVRAVADLDESFGFRSSFNFVPEGYPLDHDLLQELSARGFEIGIHGLKHDGKLFDSHAEFARRAERINQYLKTLGAVGFRSPCTLRNPEWMQTLDIEYDLSFFDTDPYEPIPGGSMSIWPYIIGRFVELPYTLAQDFTLTMILGEKTPQIWLQKVDFIEEYCGLVLANTHPDYLVDPVTWNIYAELLQVIKEREGYWHALPRDVARWWRARAFTPPDAPLSGAVRGQIKLGAQGILLDLNEVCP